MTLDNKIEEKQPLLGNKEKDYGASSSSEEQMDSYTHSGKEKNDGDTGKSASFADLFRFATCADILLILVASLFSMVQGLGWPFMMIIFGGMTDSFIPPANMTLNDTNATAEYLKKFVENINEFTIYYCYIGAAVFVASYFQISCWVTASERQTHKLRKKFFESILRQDIAWFDAHQSGELTTRLADDLERIREGIGDKFGLVIQSLATFAGGFAIGFWKSWQMTLVMMSMTPLLAICGAFIAKAVSSFAKREQEAYAKAGSVAEEVLSCIRTVVSFRGQQKERKRYNEKLAESERIGIKKALVTAVGFGLTMLINYGSYALAFWYGSTLLLDGLISPGTIFTVFFCVLIGSFSLGNIGPNLSNVATAKGAAAKVFEIIDREPLIDASQDDGETLDFVKGNIELADIHFQYPTRPDVQVLKGLSLSVKSGQTVALVGSSGCGKSTVVNLIQRFYDPAEGQILLDGQDIKSLNIKWLRDQIGIVSQEPVLFGCSIAENIRYGRLGASQSEIEEAASAANAHNFIRSLPQGYETLVGERGAQLSGGQKQRVAIARALIRNPKFLLLDEATSALDSASERVVQAALDKVREGRTTLVIAHRLSTIQNADLIYVIQEGTVVETGNHVDLMDQKGVYYQLVTLQKLSDEEENKDEGEKPTEGIHHVTRQHSVKRSTSVVSKEEEEEKLDDEPVDKAGYFTIFALNKPEISYIIIGCLGAVIVGSSMPIFAVLFSELIRVFAEPDPDKLREAAIFWSMMFLAFGGLTGLGHFSMQFMLGLSGEKLTKRLRLKTFHSMLQQDIEWFDDPYHSTGALTTRLATDASMVKNATGIRLAVILQSIVSLLAGLGIAFVFGWQLALALVGSAPVLAIAGVIQAKIVKRNQKRDSELLEDAGKIANEAIENIRTVHSLTREDLFYTTYCDLLKKPHRESLKQAQIYGVAFAFSQAVMFFLYAGAFRFGGWLVTQGEMEAPNVFRVFFAIAFAGLAMGQAASFLPDYSKAQLAAGHILKIFNAKPRIGCASNRGRSLEGVNGDIQFKDTSFNYPMRENVKVLKGMNLEIYSGQTVALVGPSGAGKSTVVSLLQRFYDPAQGEIMLDGVDLKELDVHWLRGQISVVSQEPVLFNCSIRDNIAYGVEREISDHDIMDMAKAANIHDFIISLPAGYGTVVGEKGTQLSGGQKQRVAIARALLCNPKILLLDEATSALDTESEKLVQAALDCAQEGRTCIVIAHRLSTVQNANTIAVIENGVVIEQGNHQQLLAKKGAYYALASAQRQLR